MSDVDAKDKDLLSQLPELDEKKLSSDSDLGLKDSKLESERVSYVEEDTLGDVLYVKGEPVVQDGRDVSRFVVDLRDDGDDALTFRGLVLGTIFGGLGAALYQVRIHKISMCAMLTSSIDLQCVSIYPLLLLTR